MLVGTTVLNLLFNIATPMMLGYLGYLFNLRMCKIISNHPLNNRINSYSSSSFSLHHVYDLLIVDLKYNVFPIL